MNKTFNQTHITAFIYGISPFVWILYGFGTIIANTYSPSDKNNFTTPTNKKQFFLLENAFNHQIGTLYYNIRDTNIIGGVLADAPDQGIIH